MYILHGEHTVQSRDELSKIISSAKETQTDVVRLSAKKLTLSELEQALVSTSLFGTEQLVVLEELHSLPKSKRKDELIALVAAHASSAAQDHAGIEMILWESRARTATMLKKFPAARAKEFQLSKSLFTWLDSLGSKNQTQKLQLLQQAVASEGEHLCFLMLVRQIRLLIQAADGGTIKGAPFMITKLQRQARSFSLPQLLATHRSLLKLDYQMKRSESVLSLSQQLDLLTLSL